jgi:hypothetical protein
LNYKGLAYKTEWIEYPDIADLCKKIGAEPTMIRKDGRPYYSLPVIQDPKTGAVISDSARIAEYLDETYPDTPKVFPAGALCFAVSKMMGPDMIGLQKRTSCRGLSWQPMTARQSLWSHTSSPPSPESSDKEALNITCALGRNPSVKS